MAQTPRHTIELYDGLSGSRTRVDVPDTSIGPIVRKNVPSRYIHALVASGALADDGARWIAGGRKFLFPVRGLSKMFRAKYLNGLAELLAGNQLAVPGQLAQLSRIAHRRGWLRRLRKKPRVVYSQRPFAGPRKLLDYLGRYTHRVAISNDRLLACEDGQVRFTWRDRRNGDRRKQISLSAEEFIRRFPTHVLPDRFMRVRHYGLLANRGKRERLAQVRRLLGAGSAPKPREEPPQTAAQWLQALLEIDVDRCPCCGEVLLGERLPPADDGLGTMDAWAGCVTPWDTS